MALEPPAKNHPKTAPAPKANPGQNVEDHADCQKPLSRDAEKRAQPVAICSLHTGAPFDGVKVVGEATFCLQLAEADLRAAKGCSGFDPQRTSRITTAPCPQRQ